MKEGVAGEFSLRIRVSGVVFRHFEFLQTCNAIWEENKLLEPSLLLSRAPHVTFLTVSNMADLEQLLS